MAISIRANVKTMEVPLPIGIYLKADETRHKTCVVKAMDGNDEEAISAKRIRNNGAKMVTALLAKKIVKVGDNEYPDGIGEKIARNMFTDDRDTCLIAIRSLMNDKMSVDVTCPHCGATFEKDFSMSRKLKQCSEWGKKEIHVESEEVGVIPFELPDGLILTDDSKGKPEEFTCKKGKLKLPNGRMEEQVAKNGLNNPGEANTVLLKECILEIEHIRRVDEDVIKALSRNDREYLAEVVNDAKVGPEFLENIECEQCSNEFKFFLQLPNFFTSGRSQN